MNKAIFVGLGLVLAAFLGGCSHGETATPSTPEAQTAAQSQAASAAQKGMATDAANQKAQQADAARRAAGGK